MNEVWSRSDCGYCDEAKKLLKDYGFEFKEYNVYEHKEEFKEKFPGVNTVPQIIFNNKHVGGYLDLVEEFDNCNIFLNGWK